MTRYEKTGGYEMVTVTHAGLLSRDFPNKKPDCSKPALHNMYTHSIHNGSSHGHHVISLVGIGLILSSVLPFVLQGQSVQPDQ